MLCFRQYTLLNMLFRTCSILFFQLPAKNVQNLEFGTLFLRLLLLVCLIASKFNYGIGRFYHESANYLSDVHKADDCLSLIRGLKPYTTPDSVHFLSTECSMLKKTARRASDIPRVNSFLDCYSKDATPYSSSSFSICSGLSAALTAARRSASAPGCRRP